MRKEDDSEILGCFVSGPATYHDTDPTTRESLKGKAETFRSYIWGEFGLSQKLKRLRRSDYGRDLDFVLLKFYLLPLIEELAVLKDVERCRKKEKAIGIPIIIHDKNFFDRSDYERRRFLKEAIMEKLDLLEMVIKRNKLDTNICRLKSDVVKVLS
jgi:hypothetical protein